MVFFFCSQGSAHVRSPETRVLPRNKQNTCRMGEVELSAIASDPKTFEAAEVEGAENQDTNISSNSRRYSSRSHLQPRRKEEDRHHHGLKPSLTDKIQRPQNQEAPPRPRPQASYKLEPKHDGGLQTRPQTSSDKEATYKRVLCFDHYTP